MTLLRPEIESVFASRSDKRLDRFSYKLNEAGQFGYDVSILGDMEVCEGEKSVVFPFADGNRRDGVGDLLEIGGIDTSRHRMNPIVCFDHAKSVTLPVALAEDPKTKEYTVFCDAISQVAKVKAFFYQNTDGQNYEHALFCEQLFDLMARKYVRAGSIGYQIIDADPLQADHQRGIPKGLHLKRVLMLEASAVVLPANQDTARKALCLGSVCGKPLSPVLVKSFSPYAGGKKAQVAVPLNEDLSRTDVPPAKWKPGLGATGKAHPLRTKYKKQHQEAPSMAVKQTKALPPKEEDEAVDRAANPTSPAPKPAPEQPEPNAMQDDGMTPDAPMDNELAGTSPEEGLDGVDPSLDGSAEDGMNMGEPGGPALEKLSAQVLRRIHKDILLLMEDYDQFHQLLEHKETSDFLLATLEGMEGQLSAIEELFSTHHSDLPGIEGAVPRPRPAPGMEAPSDEAQEEMVPGDDPGENPMDAEGGEETEVEAETDTDAVPTDSSDEDIKEEPSGDEAIQGMKKGKKKPPTAGEKSLDLRKKYSKSHACDCGKKDCGCMKKDMDDEKKTKEEKPEAKEDKKDKKPKDSDSEKETSKKKESDSPDSDSEAKEELKAAKKKMKTLKDKLEDYEMDLCKDAHGYLGELSNTSDYGDEHRMKSYHYHKTMDSISRLKKDLSQAPEPMNGVGQESSPSEAPSETPDDFSKGMHGEYGSPSDHSWVQENGDSGMHKHRKCCKDASQYFLRVSREKAFGDPHRDEALMHQKALDGVINGLEEEEEKDHLPNDDPEEVQEDISESDVDDDTGDDKQPGDTDEKEVDEREFHKSYEATMEEIRKSLQELQVYVS